MRARQLNPTWLLGADVTSSDGTRIGSVESLDGDGTGTILVRIKGLLCTAYARELDDQGALRNPSTTAPKYIT